MADLVLLDKGSTPLLDAMKEINYKIKKSHNSYLWRGNGSRLFKSIYKKSLFITIKNYKHGRCIQSYG